MIAINDKSKIIRNNLLYSIFVISQKVDAFGSLYAAMALNAAVSLLFASIFWLRKLMIRLDKTLSDVEKTKKISHTKELVYRNLFFFLFVTYLSTCSKTANVLPPACRRLCINREQTLCDDYLKADYGIKCHGSQYHVRLIAAYVNLAYIFALPAFCIIVLWRQKRVFLGSEENERYLAPQENKEIVTGLRFLYENYKTKTWYWEVIEMARKVTFIFTPLPLTLTFFLTPLPASLIQTVAVWSRLILLYCDKTKR